MIPFLELGGVVALVSPRLLRHTRCKYLGRRLGDLFDSTIYDCLSSLRMLLMLFQSYDTLNMSSGEEASFPYYP